MNRYAAIDIGSNAIRLLIVGLIPNRSKQYRKISLIRVPIRLGQDSFTTGIISDVNIEEIMDGGDSENDKNDPNNSDG
mgnify:CR=1 FL=1